MSSQMTASDKDSIRPLLPLKKTDYGIPRSLLYSGSRFVGHQKSKGNCYDVEVILQVRIKNTLVPVVCHY